MHARLRPCSLVMLLALVVTASSPARGQSLYWDGAGTGPGAPGGTGTWNATNTNWDTLPFGGANTTWTNNSTAVFGGTAGTATINTSGIAVGGLLFNTTAYRIAAGTNGLTFSSGNNSIQAMMANTGTTATITGTVGGSGADLILSTHPLATSTLTFNGTSAGGWTGATTINSGMTLATTTISGSVNQVLNNTSAITLNGGAITFNRATNAQLNAISDNATITVNGGGTFNVTSADAGGGSANETIGAVNVSSGQMNFSWNSGASSGSQVILSGLSPSGAGSVTFSSGNYGQARWRVMGAGNTTGGQIIGPWATTGGQSGVAAQTDYAVYGSDFVAPANIAATAESSWTTAANAYTMSALTSATLTANRSITAIRSTNNGVTVTASNPNIALASTGLAVGDVVTFSAATMPTGLTAGTPYYVVLAPGNGTFQVSATKNGTAITPSTAGTTVVAASGIQVDTNANLRTSGILNGSATTLNIVQNAGNGNVSLPSSGAGNLYVTTGAGAISIAAPIVNFDGSSPLTLVKNGSGGTLTLSSTNNTYTGGTVINAGTLSIGNVGNIGGASANLTFSGTGTLSATGTLNFSTGTLTVGQGAVLSQDGGFAVTFQTTTGAGTIVSRGGSGAGTLNLGNASAFTGNLEVHSSNGTNPYPAVRFSNLGDGAGSFLGFGGNIGDSNQRQSFTFNGTSPLTFDARRIALLPATGSSTARYNTLSNDSAGNATWTINTDLLNASNRGSNLQELIFAGTNTGNNSFNGAIGDSTTTATGALWIGKTGTGKWIFSGNNTFTGRLIVNQGTLSVATFNNASAAGPLGQGLIQLGGSEVAIGTGINNQLGSNNSGTLEYTGGAATSNRSFIIGDTTTGTGGGTITNNGTGDLVFTAANFNTAVAGNGTRTLTLGGTHTGNNTIEGVIQNNTLSAGLVALTKADAGKWILSNTNTYTGGTTINAGTLVFSGNVTVSPTTGSVTINGGTLELQANAGNTISGVSSAVGYTTGSAAGNASPGLNVGASGVTFRLSSNSSVTFTGTSGIAGLSSRTLNIDVGNNGSGSNNVITFSPNGNVHGGSNTVNITGTNGYSLVLGDWNSNGTTGTLTFNPTTANVTVGNMAANTGTPTRTVALSGNGSTNAIGAITSGNFSVTKSGNSTWAMTGNSTYNGTTTINAGTLQIGNGGGTGSLATTSVITNNGTLAFNRNDTVTQGTHFNSVIGGTGTVTQRGSGSLILNGINTYTGSTTVRAGTLVAGANVPSGAVGAFGNSTSAILVGTANTGASDAPSLLIGGSFTVGRAVTVGSTANANAYSATIGGSNTSGTSTFSGDITLDTTASNYTVTLQAGTGGTVDFTTGTWTTNNKAIAIGSSGNAGTVRLSNTLATTGGISVNFGTFQLGANDRIGDTTPLTVNGGTLDTGSGLTDTVAAFTLLSGSVTGNGTISSATTYDARSGTVAGNLGGSVGLTKSTAGLVVLSGTNTYSGLTTVSGGTLSVNGSIVSNLFVNAGATFGGTGTVNGNAVIEGIHAPGNSPGIQTFGSDLTYSAGNASVSWELVDNTTTNQANPNAVYDQILVGGNLTFADPTELDLAFNGANSTVSWNSTFWDTDQSWTLHDVAGTTSGFGNFTLNTTDWLDSTSTALSTARPGSSFNVSQVGQDILINYVAVPEPATLALLGAGVAFLGFRLARRRL